MLLLEILNLYFNLLLGAYFVLLVPKKNKNTCAPR